MAAPMPEGWKFELPAVPNIHDVAFRADIQQRLDGKTKPPRSLAVLEHLALHIAQALGTARPALHQPQLIAFAADHGIAAAHPRISAYPQVVTAQVVENMLAGGAGVSVFARQHGIALHVVDCGVVSDFAPREQDPHDKLPPALGTRDAPPRLWRRKLARGTADACAGPAMSGQLCDMALRTGARVVAQLPGNAVLLGEMGVGNTSAAALLLARLVDAPIEAVTGCGSGLDAAARADKVAVLRQALAANPADPHIDGHSPQAAWDALQRLGGLEIAAMVGAVLEAAAARRLIVADGFITTVAILVAARVAPAVVQRCVFSHHSAEPGHALALAALARIAEQLAHSAAQGSTQGGAIEGTLKSPVQSANPAPHPCAQPDVFPNVFVPPLLAWNMRLGEGSGAALAWPLLLSACAVLNEMADFASTGMATGHD